MSITDELRKWWVRKFPVMDKELHDDFTAIADRIDSEYQKAMDEWKAKHGQMWLKGYGECHAELLEGNETLAADLEGCGWVRLPLDADGVPIRVGDLMEDGKKVARIVLTDGEWEPYVYIYEQPNVLRECFCNEISHYQPPTVEDLLEEMYDALEDARIPNSSEKRTYEEIIAEYAAKLRLAESEEE